MEVCDAHRMRIAVPVACRQLLENIQVAELDVIVGIIMKGESHKKTVLVEVIIYHFFAKVYMQFIIQNPGERAGRKMFFTNGAGHKKIIPYAVIEIMPFS